MRRTLCCPTSEDWLIPVSVSRNRLEPKNQDGSRPDTGLNHWAQDKKGAYAEEHASFGTFKCPLVI